MLYDSATARQPANKGKNGKGNARKPAYLGLFHRGCPTRRMDGVTQHHLPVSPLFIRLPKMPAIKPSIHAASGDAYPKTLYP